MEVSGIKGQTSFNGVMRIANNINPKTKSSLSKIMQDIDISNKPYDITVKNHPENKNFITITAQNKQTPKQSYEVWVHHFMQKVPVLKDAVTEIIEKYEQKFGISS